MTQSRNRRLIIIYVHYCSYSYIKIRNSVIFRLWESWREIISLDSHFSYHLGFSWAFGFVDGAMDLKHTLKIKKNQSYLISKFYIQNYENREQCFVNVMSTNVRFVLAFRATLRYQAKWWCNPTYTLVTIEHIFCNSGIFIVWHILNRRMRISRINWSIFATVTDRWNFPLFSKITLLKRSVFLITW